MAARVTAFVVIAIVAVTFVAGLIVGAQRADDSGPVDLIVYNAKVFTGNPDAPFAEAIAIRGSRILRVGSNREIKRLMRRATSVIDAHGGSVTPGFHDGGVNLTAVATASAAPAAGVAAVAHGSTSPASSTSSSALSAPASSAKPTATATPAATAVASAAKAPAATHAPTATIADANPTGTAVDAGLLDGLRAAMADANRVGVTSVEVTARNETDLAPYDTLSKTRGLTTRVAAAMAVDWPLDDAAIERLDATRRRFQRVPVFKVDAIRLTVSDGFDASGAPIDTAAAGATGAGARKHVAHGATARSRGMAAKAAAAAAAALATRTTALSQTIARLGQRGWQIILQTADAGDVDLALTAVASSRISVDPKERSPKRRIRLELGSPIDDATVARVAQLGVIPSLLQPSTAGLLSAPATASLTGNDASRTLSAAPKDDARPGQADDLPPRADAASATKAVADSASATATGDPAAAAAGRSVSSADSPRADADTDALASAPSSSSPRAATSSALSASASAMRATAGAGDATANPTRAAGATKTAAGAAADAEQIVEPESWPFANLLNSAAPFVFHSDWPTAPLDPRLALSTVLLEGLIALSDEATTIADDEKISARLTRALDAYTRYAAFASADEEQKGTIAKERLADLVIFSTDLFALPATKLLDAEVTTTIFDGKIVFARSEPVGVPITP